MRAELVDRNPVRVESAACGCERYEVDGADAMGGKRRSVVCLHVCGQNAPPRAPRKRHDVTTASKRSRNRK